MENENNKEDINKNEEENEENDNKYEEEEDEEKRLEKEKEEELREEEELNAIRNQYEEEQRKLNEEMLRLRIQHQEELKRNLEELKRMKMEHEKQMQGFNKQYEENLRQYRIQQEEHEAELRRFRIILSQGHDFSSQPISEEVLKKLNKFVFNDDIKDKDGNIEKIKCCICLNDIIKNEEVVKLPCNHIHHWNCCINWLRNKSICPMCRFEIK